MGEIILTSTLALSGLLFFTQETVVKAEDVSSQVNTTVIAGDGSGTLIDPNVKPATNSTGTLTIDAVSSFNFGSLKVGTTSKIAETTNAEKLGIQVRDVRGTGAGWALNVKIGAFTNTIDATKELAASVYIPQGTVTNGVDNATGVVTKEAVLNDSFITIMNAPIDKGMGSWLNTFESSSNKVTLQNIAQNAYIGSYKSTMNWQLVDAPS